MFKHTPPEVLERVARAMCVADHNDPDRKVTRYIQEHLNGLAQHKAYLPSETHQIPAWHLYTHLVPAAIEALEPIPLRYDPVKEMKQLGLSYEQLAADILNEPFENKAQRSVDFLAANKASST